MYNEAIFRHICLSCTHNFVTCSNSHPLFLEDARKHAAVCRSTKLPGETDLLPGDLILWCDMHEEVDLDKEKVILEKAGDHFDITTDGLVSRMLSIEDAHHFIERYNLREVFPGTYILPSKE